VVDLVVLWLQLLLVVVDLVVVVVIHLLHIQVLVELDQDQLDILEEQIYLLHHLVGGILVEVDIQPKHQIILVVEEEDLPPQEQLHHRQVLREMVEMDLPMILVEHQ
jgi:hypothetical protein